MEGYLKSLIERKEFLELRKNLLEKDLAPIIKELDTIEELISIYNGSTPYPRKESIKSKVLYILNQIKGGSYRDIEKAIESYGDTINSTSLKITCANLSRSGEIKIKETSGRTNIYSL